MTKNNMTTSEEKTAEIKKELATLSAKYGFKKIIFLGEEKDSTTDKEICRVSIYANQEGNEFDIHEFALFYMACLQVSKTLREISNHMAEHLLDKVLHKVVKEEVMEERLKRGDTKRAD